MSKRCVVIGASAGGVEALRDVAARLPANLGVPVFVVLHVPPFMSSSLPEILTCAGQMPAEHPVDGTRIEPGRIYVAPPDHHLLIENDKIGVKKGPKENRFRPSVDALFRSAAYTYGAGAIGVVLSGALDDGVSGLWSIKRLGGTAMIQELSQARFESMPRSVLDYVEPDHILASTEIGTKLAWLVQHQSMPEAVHEPEVRQRLATEVDIAARDSAFQKGVMKLGELTEFTCPDCHGVLVRVDEGKLSRFRCHTGHAYTDNALLEGVMDSVGDMLWQVIRSLEEAVMVLKHMGENLQKAGEPARAETFFAKARELEERSTTYHSDTLRHESLSGDNLGQASRE